MKPNVGRLSALPQFLKSGEFWDGVMDPRESVDWGYPVSSDRSAFEFYVDGFSPCNGAV
ncbi:hypothetical protein JJQ59_04785 [Cupriavidus necator]|uniref:hypothetical protein n=1 Tax=Cupriavidus necator TaxID=106590 RepID=UPI00167795A6|nr:hypothetical protein [Cupriavidus necator]QQX86289.1 hypothetical protein JJQ59_04785 [Cupriavidus necator]